jgi:hypothetical protein
VQIAADRLTVEDILADTPSRVLADLGYPGFTDRSALALLDEADRLSPWGVTITDILGESVLYRHAVANAH